MARALRHLERVEFGSDAPAEVVGFMTRLADAGDGWINLVPKLSEDDQSTSLGAFTLFSGGGMGVTMCTWIPASQDHRGQKQTRLGITHMTGRRAVARLASLDVEIPATWRVEQDHPRRGLVVHLPTSESHERVLAWALRAVSALSPQRPIRVWRADVYFPSAS